jgi:hypothetical protein
VLDAGQRRGQPKDRDGDLVGLGYAGTGDPIVSLGLSIDGRLGVFEGVNPALNCPENAGVARPRALRAPGRWCRGISTHYSWPSARRRLLSGAFLFSSMSFLVWDRPGPQLWPPPALLD